MSRKLYTETARLLRETELSAETRKTLVNAFVTFFADENPRFSPSKFRDAAQSATDDDECEYTYDGETEGSLTAASLHVCDERSTTDGGDFKYQGSIAAPGYGDAYECVVCGAPRVRLGTAWIDPRESDPIELQPEDVI